MFIYVVVIFCPFLLERFGTMVECILIMLLPTQIMFVFFSAATFQVLRKRQVQVQLGQTSQLQLNHQDYYMFSREFLQTILYINLHLPLLLGGTSSIDITLPTSLAAMAGYVSTLPPVPLWELEINGLAGRLCHLELKRERFLGKNPSWGGGWWWVDDFVSMCVFHFFLNVHNIYNI